MKLKFVLVALAAILITGCDVDNTSAAGRYANTLNTTFGYQHAREVGRGYVMYEIEGGKVTCREHVRRAELTCWATLQ